jgi:phosphatidylserine/phosphatidylglycerophosphate/cardiolipin synthase-like enzyme
LLVACGNEIPIVPTETALPGTELTPIELQSGFGVRGLWFELYFTDPNSPLSPQATGGLDGPLVEAIDAARLSIDVAAYSISLNSVRNALLRAHDRGVTVRVVMETGNMDRSDPQIMIEAGIPIIGDNRNGLMHDKFIVLDRSEVWLGSMNFTDSGTYEDNNNLMSIQSSKIAENYIKEFEEMFLEDRFGEDVVAETPNPTLTIDGTRVDTFFSPDDGVLNALASLLNSAEESIYFLAFSFTSNDLGDIVRKKAEAGLTIAGVMDNEQIRSNQGTEFDPFRQAGLDVLIDGIDGQMHHKVFIVDEKIVVLGSYNFSQAAEVRNDENVLIIYHEKIAEQFVQEFRRVYGQSHD